MEMETSTDETVSRKRQHSPFRSDSPLEGIDIKSKKKRISTKDASISKEIVGELISNPNEDSLLETNKIKTPVKTNLETNECSVDIEQVQLSDDHSNNEESMEKNTLTPLKKNTPNKKLTPKQKQKKIEVEERLKKKVEEKEKILQEKLKKKQQKEKEIEERKKEKDEMRRKEREEKEEMRRKEREEKEEHKKKDREEKEQKRKEKEEQKRKEREQEKQKKLQGIEEKNKEKLKEEEKKQKAAAAFVNFFVPKKCEETQDEKKIRNSNFLQFEVKSDMKLPLPRRATLTEEEKETLDKYLENQNKQVSYLKDLALGKLVGKSVKTWPCEEIADEDVVLVGLGETICEDISRLQKHKAKFLCFHENRRPAYYGTWRKTSKNINPRKPFGEDKELINYEEDSDDDWEEEEQGESLNGSEDEAEKDNDDEKDEYEVDNEFFVPHGHLSDDEVDDEQTTRLSPDSLKQKLKLLKEEFDQDMKLKTHKLKPRSIGCIWYNKDGSNVEEPVDRYLQPLAIITRHTQIVIKSRIHISNLIKERKKKELDPKLIRSFLKLVHGRSSKKSVLVEEFIANLQKTASNAANVSKNLLTRKLKQCAVWEKYKDEDTNRYKFRWCVHSNMRDQYDLNKEDMES